MERYLNKYSPYLYFLLRFVSGLMFAMHGSQKVLGIPGDRPHIPFGSLFTSLMGIAGIIELVGGLMIAFGLLTGYAAFIASGQMAVAYFKAHFPDGFLPIINKGELAVIYCFVFLYISSQGSGIWSLDGIFRRQKK